MGLNISPGDTPFDFAGRLSNRLSALCNSFPGWERLAKALNPAIEEARHLVELYSQAVYSPRPPDTTHQAQAMHAWERLRRRLWLARVLAFKRRGI